MKLALALLPLLTGVPSLAAAQAPTPEAPPGARVGYKKGAFIESDDGRFRLDVNGRFQFREDTTDPKEGDTTSRFYIARSRILLHGHVFGANTRYKLEYGVSEKGASYLKDLYGNQSFLGGWVQLRFGQYKRPFGRQFMTSDFNLEMPEASEVNSFEQDSRDMGLMLHNGYEESPNGFEYELGIFNGVTTEVPTTPVTTTCMMGMTITCTSTSMTPTNVPKDWEPAFVGRFSWNFGGIKGYSEGDLERGPLRFSLGVAFRENIDDLTNLDHAVHVDGIVKLHGLDVTGAWVWFKNSSGDAKQGFFAQAGYFITPGHLQVVGRFASIDSSNTDGHTLEGRGGLNYFFEDHRYKVMTDYGIVKDTGTPLAGKQKTNQFEARLLGQLMF